MSRIDELFTQLRSENRKAFMPFITAGDPDLEFTSALLKELDRRGSHLIELGIPYSDPIADGPVIQASYTRALASGVRWTDIQKMLQETTPQLTAPVVTMVSYAIVLRVGPDTFIKQARAAGVEGAIVPDLPAEEAKTLSAICAANDFSLVQLVTPTTSPERALSIARTSTGFLYYVSVTGITGERTELPTQLVESVQTLREKISLPICIGFGINRPEHVQRLAPVADGLIVGSAIVKRVAQPDASPTEIIESIGAYVDEMIQALP